MSNTVVEESWRKADIDALRALLAGECVWARFRDSSGQNWVERLLIGFADGEWVCDQRNYWKECQVRIRLTPVEVDGGNEYVLPCGTSVTVYD
jgi:hypothetical protein